MIEVQLAQENDADTVVNLYREAQRWLASKGLDQWQRPPGGGTTEDYIIRARKGIESAIKDGTCYIARLNGTTVGTATIDDFADPEFWQEAESPSSALYVHRMITAREAAGQGVGAALLGTATELARARGKRWVRLDAWRTNAELHRYYLSQGFRHVRTVVLEHRGSGALFQREASR